MRERAQHDSAVLSIDNAAPVWEDGQNGTAGAQTSVFHVRLSNPVDVPITIVVQLMSDGSPGFVFSGNPGADIIWPSGTQWTYQIPASTTDYTISINTVPDTTPESTETYRMCIMSMSFATGVTRNVTGGDWTAIGTIWSNEAP